ncbi:MAG: hypothetical protein WD928_08510 [Gammaproteobacteria bacterium]
MQAHDLSSQIPHGAQAVEILVCREPDAGMIEVRLHPDDSSPVFMTDGSTTSIDTPRERRLYVTLRAPVERCRISVLRWFR